MALAFEGHLAAGSSISKISFNQEKKKSLYSKSQISRISQSGAIAILFHTSPGPTLVGPDIGPRVRGVVINLTRGRESRAAGHLW